MSAERTTLALAVGVLAVVGLAPVLALLAGSLTVEGRPSLGLYEAVLDSPRQWLLLRNSVVLSSAVAAIAAAVGLPLGVLFAKTDLPLRRALAALFTIPMLLPPYVLAVAWFHVLGRGGLVARWLGPGVAEVTDAFLFGLPGVVLVMTSGLTPLVMILTMAFVRTVPLQLEEAAKLVSGWKQTLMGITVPSILPGVLLGALLVFLLALGEFAVPMFLRYDVYAVESFTRFAAFYRPEAAVAAAVPLGLIALALLVLERLLLRERTYQVRFVGSAVLEVPLGALRPGLFASVAAVGLVAVGLPLGSLALRSAVPGAYAQALALGGAPLLRSFVYAAAGATLLTAIGFLLGYLVQRRAMPFWRAADSLTILLFALPSTVLGIGLVTLWNRPATDAIYGTAWLVLIGYVAQYSALTSRSVVAGLGRVPASMEEAAQLGGAGWLRRLGLIVAPLLGRSLAVSWLVAYLFCMRDTGLVMMTYPPGGDTLPVRTFTTMANGAPELIAALCMIMVLATLVPVALAAVIVDRRSRERPLKP